LLVGETNTIGMELIRIPAGTFEMGDLAGVGRSNERPVHTVTLTRDFYIGRYEVTQGEFVTIVGINFSHFRGHDRLPVEYQTWYDIIRFANALSVQEGYAPCYDDDGKVIGGGGNPYACEGYRLPTEAEWEYATRAGTTTIYSFGNDSGELANYGWYRDTPGTGTHVVGEKRPNTWGLYDVHGNVVEWLYDPYSEDYYERSPSSDPFGQYTGNSLGLRVVRGGCYYYQDQDLRSAYRGGFRSSR